MTGARAKFHGAQTVERALRALDVLTETGTPMRLSDLAQATGLNISTLSRLLASLERADYVTREPETGRYRLGFKVLRMAQVALEQMPLPAIARPILTTLMQDTGETATINVLHEDRAMVIARVECSSPLRIVSSVGASGPLYCTAHGKVMLAHMPSAEVARILAKGMPRLTPLTITTPEAMMRELQEIRQRGWALDPGEREEGLISIAAPVVDASGALAASCGVSGSAQRMRTETVPKLARLVVEAATELSRQLGWQPAVGVDRECREQE